MSATGNIHSVATFACWPIYQELVLLIRSLRVFHPTLPLYLLTQSRVAEQLSKDGLMDDNIIITIGLDEYGSSWKEMSPKEAAAFLAHKATVAEIALAKHPNTLFVDCDVLILAPLPKIDETKDLGLVPLRIKNYDIHGSGKLDLDSSVLSVIEDKYLSCFLFINNSNIPYLWKKAIHQVKDPQLYVLDQVTLNDLTESFSYFFFSFNDCLFMPLHRDQYKWLLKLRRLKTQPILSHRNKPIRSIHRHFLNQHRWNLPLIFFLYLLYESRSPYFDYIGTHPNGQHYSLAQLKEGCVFFFIRLLRGRALHRVRFLLNKERRGADQSQSLYYLLVRIYRGLIFPYYLMKEICILHRIIRRAEFAMSKSELFILAFGYHYKLLGRKYYHIN